MLTNTMKTEIALEVAFGMSHLHKLGMIHRDLRIDNIMLNSGFEAKIIGLIHHGIAEMLTRDIGTLTYMSLEMQNEDTYDNKTDVYSNGVIILRTCLTFELINIQMFINVFDLKK